MLVLPRGDLPPSARRGTGCTVREIALTSQEDGARTEAESPRLPFHSHSAELPSYCVACIKRSAPRLTTVRTTIRATQDGTTGTSATGYPSLTAAERGRACGRQVVVKPPLAPPVTVRAARFDLLRKRVLIDFAARPGSKRLSLVVEGAPLCNVHVGDVAGRAPRPRPTRAPVK